MIDVRRFGANVTCLSTTECQGMNHEYDQAQVCLNGHIITRSYIEDPSRRKEYCPDCGARTMTSCPDCDNPLKGQLIDGSPVFGGSPDLYCEYCGKPFPWTKEKIRAAIELWVEESGASGVEANQFESTINDLSGNTPRTPLAASRFGKAMQRVSAETSHAIRSIIVEIMSEAVRKSIWPER